MQFSRATALLLGVTTLAALGLVAARPASAQNLEYQLVGVTFSDGAAAFGSFDYNPTTNTFGAFDITTTDGVTDTLTGYDYTAASSTAFSFAGGASIFDSLGGKYGLVLFASGNPASPGTYPLTPGTALGPGSLENSGEHTPSSQGTTVRVIVTGSLVVSAVPVPEASTTVSFSLLLALGLGGIVTAAKRKKAIASA